MKPKQFYRRMRSDTPLRYRVSPRLCFLVGCLYPGSLIAPSTLSAGAMTIPRFFLFLTGFSVARELWHKLTRGGYVPIASDFFVLIMAGWMLAAIYINEGSTALTGSAALSAIEFLIAYFLARTFFGTPLGFSQLIYVMRFISIVILATALIDTFSGQNVLSEFGRRFSHGDTVDPLKLRVYVRFGLARAMGPLEHSILMGTFFVICFILFMHSTMTRIQKIIWVTLCVVGALLPLSSAPLLSLLMSISAIIFLRVFQNFPWRMIFLGCTVVFALSAFIFLVESPLTTLIQNLTYDPQTGMFRVMIWQWVGLNIERAPWIGIGMADWIRSPDMPGSIDSLYLVQAIRYGLPSLVFLGLSILTTGVTMPLRPQLRFSSGKITTIRTGMAIAIFIYVFNAFTVHFWGSSWTMLAIILGIRAGLTESIYLSPSMRGDTPKKNGDSTAPTSSAEESTFENTHFRDQALAN